MRPPEHGWRRSFAAGALAGTLLAAAGLAAAQGGIYTCVDSKGRRLTSDRPIAECVDREQKELSSSGTVKRSIGPSLTAEERAAKEAREAQAAADRARLAEERRRDRALLIRYPNRAVHDKERAEALAQVDEVMKAAQKRITELERDRKGIDAEMEFYKKDPSKAPVGLKRQVEDNTHSLDVQRRFVADQVTEKNRVNARFDEDLVRLRRLWSLSAPTNLMPELPGASGAGPAR